MNQTLDNLLELAGQQAHLILLDLKRSELVPSWVFVQEDGSSRILATPFRDDGQKEATVAYVRAWMRNHGTVAYSFLCEAWSATLTPEEWDPKGGKPIPEADQPRNRVDRIEVAYAIATDGTETQCRAWQIVRDWQGKVVGLTPRDVSGSGYEGRFTGLLSKTPK
jgi:hypothetical protein